MKNYKTKTKQTVAKRMITLLFALLAGASMIGNSYWALADEISLVTTVSSGQEKKNLSIQEYVFEEVKRELGMKETIKAVVLIQCESQWRDDIVIQERNGTVSLGLWQINTVHNNKKSPNYISNADKLDYKKATAWAIKKRKSDGNWSAWMCAR